MAAYLEEPDQPVQEQPEGTPPGHWHHKLDRPVPPGRTALVTVRHTLRTMDLTAYCYTAAGDRMGYEFAVPLDEGSLEVACLGGCTRILLVRDDAPQPE